MSRGLVRIDHITISSLDFLANLGMYSRNTREDMKTVFNTMSNGRFIKLQVKSSYQKNILTRHNVPTFLPVDEVVGYLIIFPYPQFWDHLRFSGCIGFHGMKLLKRIIHLYLRRKTISKL